MDQQANQQPQQQTNIIPDDSPNPHPNGFLITEVYYNKMQKIIDQIVENFNERNWDFQNEDDDRGSQSHIYYFFLILSFFPVLGSFLNI